MIKPSDDEATKNDPKARDSNDDNAARPSYESIDLGAYEVVGYWWFNNQRVTMLSNK